MKRTILLILALTAGCSHTGLRKLEANEQRYFGALAKELGRSRGELAKLTEGNRLNEEQAVREVVLQEVKVEAAKLVYSVREVLTAPRGDSAEFIQATRNKVILLELAGLADVEDRRVKAEMSVGDERRRQIQALSGQLFANVQDVIATEQTLHAYLNRSDVQAAADLAQEVKRQIDAFNGALAQTEHPNPVTSALGTAGTRASESVAKANDATARFIDLWSKLNRTRE